LLRRSIQDRFVDRSAPTIELQIREIAELRAGRALVMQKIMQLPIATAATTTERAAHRRRA